MNLTSEASGHQEEIKLKLYFLCTFPPAVSASFSAHINNYAENVSFSNHQYPQGRAPLNVTMGRHRREQKVGLRGWICADIRDFLSLQSVELSGL